MMLSDFKKVRLTSSTMDLMLEPNPSATNYDIVPDIRVIESIGSSMKLASNDSLIRHFWQQFGDESQYRVYLKNSEDFMPLITTRHGDRVVGAMSSSEGGGKLIALPWIDLERKGVFTEEYEGDNGEVEYRWTPAAKKWGNRFLKALSYIDQALKGQGNRTPTPQWAQSDTYKTGEEIKLYEEHLRLQGKIADLRRKSEDTEANLADAGSLKALLFEQGDPLEEAVLKAMRLMGFSANRYRDSESEFDAVLECSEGRCIGEVEGRDNKAINIDKMRQLETNILEDLSRNEVSEPAKAVLFGNAFRLKPPSERPSEHFTQKCKSAAHRNGTALVRTSDLFTVAKALSDNSNDKFAAACRAALLNTSGREVEFPPLPESTAVGATNDGRNRPEKLTEGDSDTMG